MRKRLLHYLTGGYLPSDENLFSSPWRHVSVRHKVVALTLLSLGANELRFLRLLGGIALYFLLFYITYVLAQRILSHMLRGRAPGRGARAILAGAAVGVAFSSELRLIFHPLIFFLVIVATAIVLDIYLALTDTSGWHYSDDYVIQLESKFSQKSFAEVQAKQRKWESVLEEADSWWLEKVTNYIQRAATVFGISSPFYFLGLFYPVFDLFYPVPELTLLVGAVFGPTIARKTHMFEKYQGVLDSLDSEGYFTEAISSESIFQLKGLTLIVFIGSNLLLPAVVFFLSIGMIGAIADRIVVFAGNQPLVLTIFVGILAVAIVSTPLLFALYGLWYWRTAFQRLPAFLRYWEADKSESRGNTAEVVDSLKTRPPHGMLPPTVHLLTLSLIFSIPLTTRTEAIVGILVYLIFWLVGLAYIIWSIQQWTNTKPQPIGTEPRSLVRNCIIQFVGIIPFLSLIICSVKRISICSKYLVSLLYQLYFLFAFMLRTHSFG